MDFSNIIDDLIKDFDIKSISALAEMAGVPRSTISNIKLRKSIPNGETLSKIADALGVSTDYLLGCTDNPNPINNNKKAYTIESESLLVNYFLNKIGRLPNKEELKRLDDFVDVYLKNLGNKDTSTLF